MKKICLALLALQITGCVSYSRHVDLLADTKPNQLHGTCADTRYQNSVELSESKIKIRSDRFIESGAFGVIVPFDFKKSDVVTFNLSGFDAKKDLNTYGNEMRLQIADKEIKPNSVDGSDGYLRIKFPIETLKNINEVKLKLSPESTVTFYTDRGWFFMPILVPHSNGCSGTDKI